MTSKSDIITLFYFGFIITTFATIYLFETHRTTEKADKKTNNSVVSNVDDNVNGDINNDVDVNNITDQELLVLFVCAESREVYLNATQNATQNATLKPPQIPPQIPPLKAQQGLVALVLNRVNDPTFPNTINEVIFQPSQFACTKNGEFSYTEKSFTQEELEHGRAAVEAVLNGADPTGGALFYSLAYNESAVTEDFGWFIFFKAWPH